MLKALRHKGIQKNIFIGLAVTVILGFGVSMVVLSHDDKKTSGSLGTLGNHHLSVQEYLESYRAVQHQAEWMFGEKFNEIRNRINFKGEAWDRLLLLDHAKNEGIRASDKDVLEWLTSQSAFKRDGRFDEKYYQMYVERALRSTPRAFEEEIRQMLTIQKIPEKLKTGETLSDDKLKELYAQDRGERSLLYAILPWENFKDQVTVTDKDVDQLYPTLKDEIKDPKTGQPMPAPEAKETLKKSLLQQKAAEMAMKKMKELKEKIKTGDFEAVLKEEKIDVTPLEKYRRGTYPSGTYPSENLERSLSALKEGDVSDAIDVPQGAMIAKVTKTLPIDDKKFAEEKEAFRKDQAAKKGNEAMGALLEKLRKNLNMNLPLMKEIFPSDEK